MIGARDVLLIAAEWLQGRNVEPINVDISRRPDLLSGGVVMTATLQVDQEAWDAHSKVIVRDRVHGVPATSWRSQVAPRVHLLWVELDSARQVAPTLPPEPEPPGADTPLTFSDAFDAAFDRLRGARGLNLRAALPAWNRDMFDRDAFDRELYELRRAGRYVLHTHDGRHGPATNEQLDAAVIEDRTFVYVARREST